MMTADTVYRLTQEIAHLRALLTIEEKWLRRQPHSVTRDEGFRRINFWWAQLKRAEADLGAGEAGELSKTA